MRLLLMGAVVLFGGEAYVSRTATPGEFDLRAIAQADFEGTYCAGDFFESRYLMVPTFYLVAAAGC